jgi:predicted NAD/FAD-dependent oxidoreductase
MQSTGIAIIGAGLAGLTAAHFIAKWSNLPITIFESTTRPGGRVSTSQKPPGEHGARYLLGSELDVRPGDDYWRDYGLPDGRSIRDMFRDLNVRAKRLGGKDWPYWCILRPFSCRKLDPAGRNLKGEFPTAAKLLARLQSPFNPGKDKFTDWIKTSGTLDRGSLKIIKMIVAGESCAPLTHLSAEYALDCLASAVNAKEKWFTLSGGSDTLISQLSRSCPGIIYRNRACATVRKLPNNTVQVTCRSKKGLDKYYFDGVLVSSAEGHKLTEQHTIPRHFHSYISILFEFPEKPAFLTMANADLVNGVYTDDLLVNYLEAEDTKRKNHRWVLRILVPDAKQFLEWSDEQLEARCIKVLMKLRINGTPLSPPSIKRWENGLPCGGTRRSYDKVSELVYLCGDRYGRWPSMAAAIVSGARAAEALLSDLNQ